MVKLAIGGDIQTGNVGGNGFGMPDTSDNLSDMTNYEKAITSAKFKDGKGKERFVFELLADLKVMTDSTDKKKYTYLTLEKADIKDFNAKSMGAAGHGVNSEFAALRIPFRAVPFASKDAVKVTKKYSAKAPADKVGKEHDMTETDQLKIYRTGDEFQPELYAVKGGDEGSVYEDFGQRVSTKGKNQGDVLVYETFTIGQELRANKWLSEVASVEINEEILEKIGVIVE